ncbi:MAG: exodeoxyribonuclease VII small subunit [Marinobacterium sp.]|nr:exodeoxyribonuclease VII small subunit [Marinobacterium sp.]
MSDNKQPVDFEQSLSRLETLVEQLEQGDLPLESALHSFEEGVRLTRECQHILDQAEQKVQLLVENGDQLSTVPFTDEQQLTDKQPS